ncbi:RICIN domain-containing protein [Nonomuraea rhodomycinica]|uniref:RICIN domain-containing protein n=1 Tax=Nonomuraea rhodomycinica TaxID=1712872 RepID=A0A7Y6IJR1_9ACTN|nr:RICIN domain-containing protein [Nonomuraea rhodomycinica]NUW38980.1 RICIN domain-containing protein [Nonomuraea rhodomycinica]
MNGARLALAAAALLTGMLAAPGPAEAAASSPGPVRWYQIIAQHSGKCLDVAYASQAHAANVVQGTCGGPGAGYNQQWRVVFRNGVDGPARIIARHSGKCLDVAYASLAHAANVVQGTCGGPGAGDNQFWTQVPVPGRAWQGTGGPVRLVALHSGKCLDVAYASLAHAANVVQGTCGGPGSGGNQIWRFKEVAVTWKR